MRQSLSKVILHIVFSTKNREPWLESDVRPRMHAYLATICRDLGVELVRVGGVAITFTLLRRCRELFLRLN
jgi:REP element-mobilizing transposase RayT